MTVPSPPVMHSDRLRVVERFSLDPETRILTREYVATDPLNRLGEYRGTDYIGPADVPYSPDPCEWEHTFINYAERHGEPREVAEPEAERAAPSRPWWRFWD